VKPRISADVKTFAAFAWLLKFQDTTGKKRRQHYATHQEAIAGLCRHYQNGEVQREKPVHEATS
jgi:hypothetical protein